MVARPSVALADSAAATVEAELTRRWEKHEIELIYSLRTLAYVSADRGAVWGRMHSARAAGRGTGVSRPRHTGRQQPGIS